MEVTYAKDYTIIHLRIEEDLEYIIKALELLQGEAIAHSAVTATQDIAAIRKAIAGMKKGKDLQLRFS